MKTAIMIGSILLGFALTLQAKPVITDKMILALAIQETGNKTGLIGDKHMKEHSYGKYQIRRVYLADVMHVYSKEFFLDFGVKNPTLEMIRTNDKMGKWVVVKYLTIYGASYEKQTGNKMTPEIAFKIHNGGPQGWNKKFNVYKNASAYAKSVMHIYQELA